MLLVDGNGLHLALDRTSASPAEVKLIESLLDQRVLPRDPDRLIYDRAADSDPLRTELAERQIELSTSQEPYQTSDARRACFAAISTPLES